MWQLKKEQSVPIYRSIMEMIVQKIQTGELLPGEKIPSERKLAEGAERLSTKENGG